MENEKDEMDVAKLRRVKVLESKGLLKQAYQQTFNPESVFAQRVIKDLAIFCHAAASTFHSDSREHARAEGKREVYLRITQHLLLTPDQLLRILES